MQKKVTYESDQGNDAELLHRIIQCCYANDYHTSQGQKVTSDSPSFLAQTNSNTMLDLCVCVCVCVCVRKFDIHNYSRKTVNPIYRTYATPPTSPGYYIHAHNIINKEHSSASCNTSKRACLGNHRYGRIKGGCNQW